MKNNLVFALCAAVLLLTFYCDVSAAKLSARDIIAKTAETYKKLKTYQDSTEVSININAKGMQQKLSVDTQFALQRPNKVSSIAKTGIAGITFVANGDKLWIYMPVLNKYVTKKAPRDFEELAKDSLVGSQSTGPASFVKLFADEPLAVILEDVKETKLAGEEKIDGKKNYHIVLVQDKVNVELWIDVKTNLITKFYMDMTEMMKAQSKVVPGLPEMDVKYEELHKNIIVNKPIKEEIFNFTPPDGAQEVDDLLKEASKGAMSDKKSELTGTKAQDFKLEGLKQGTNYSFSKMKGKVVLLDFFATWCPPCRIELPALQKINDAYKNKNFVFVAVNSMEDRKTVQGFIDEQKFSFPVALDADGGAGNKYGVTAYPTLVLVDKKGVIQSVHVGYDPDIEKILAKEIDALLAGKSLLKE
ncbi:MAG: redoxin family protein [Elusimicrobiota bacterium]